MSIPNFLSTFWVSQLPIFNFCIPVDFVTLKLEDILKPSRSAVEKYI